MSVLSNPTARGCHQSGTNPSKTDTSTKHTHHRKCKPSERASAPLRVASAAAPASAPSSASALSGWRRWMVWMG